MTPGKAVLGPVTPASPSSCLRDKDLQPGPRGPGHTQGFPSQMPLRGGWVRPQGTRPTSHMGGLTTSTTMSLSSQLSPAAATPTPDSQLAPRWPPRSWGLSQRLQGAVSHTLPHPHAEWPWRAAAMGLQALGQSRGSVRGRDCMSGALFRISVGTSVGGRPWWIRGMGLRVKTRWRPLHSN